jgi:hypothetical protein
MNQYLPGVQYSWVEPVRDMLREKGIDVDDKTPEMRKCLADICAALDGIDYNYKDITGVIKDVENGMIEGCNTIYIDVRDPKNIDRLRVFCREYGIDFCTIYVKRDVECPNNQADIAAKDPTGYDYVIDNNGTFQELNQKCMNVAHCIQTDYKVIRNE